jgi:beta-lactam-binding protein with PASTA domain
MAMKTENKPKAGKILSNWVVKNLLIAFALVVFLIVGSMIFLNIFTKHNQELSVPDLANMSVEEAQLVAAEAGMRIDVTDSAFVKRMKRGAVYRQNPVPGSKVKQGRRISLTINAVNPRQITMPDLIGYSMRQAKAELLSRGLVLGKLIYVQDMATNNVLRQLHNNMEIEPGEMIDSEAVIDLVVGLNSRDNRTFVPYLAGLRNLSAVEAVHDHSLNIGRLRFDDTVKDYEDSLNAVVYRQTPEANDSISVMMGESVNLYLTLDHSKIPVVEEVDEKQINE